jgi:hypothetical protein
MASATRPRASVSPGESSARRSHSSSTFARKLSTAAKLVGLDQTCARERTVEPDVGIRPAYIAVAAPFDSGDPAARSPGCCHRLHRRAPERVRHARGTADSRQELGDHFVAVEIDSSPGNPDGYRTAAHSVLTEDLKDEPGTMTRAALDQVLDLFRSKLLT